MGALKKKIEGASMIEAIVASTIFLIVFTISLGTISRIAQGNDNNEHVLIDADYRCDRAFSKYSSGEYPDGTYTEEYDWGKIRIVIKPYAGYEDLRTLTIETEPLYGKRKSSFNHIITANHAYE